MAVRPFNDFLKCGFVNIQSVSNKTIQIRGLLTENSLDVLAVSETWLKSFDPARIEEMTPPTHSFHHIPREGRRGGGGVGLFTSNTFSQLRVVNRINVSSFEYMEVNFKYLNQWISFIVVYRPPWSRVNLFIEEFGALLELIDMVSCKVLVTGDFNIWMDDPENRDTISFCELLETYQLHNGVRSATSSSGHMLDLIISDATSGNFISDVEVEKEFSISPVHKLITFQILLPKSQVTKTICFRNKATLRPESFIGGVNTKFNEDINNLCVHN